MNKIIEQLKIYKKTDIISFCGTVVFAVFALCNSVRYAALGVAAPFLAMTAVSVIFFLGALYAWRSRVSAVWLVVGGCSIIAYSCTNMFGYIANVIFLLQIVIAFIAGIGAIVMQIIERLPPKRVAVITMSVLLVVCFATGGFWLGSMAIVGGKDAPAQNEIWGVPDKYDSVDCPEKGKVDKFEYATKAYATDSRNITKTAYIYTPYGYDESKEYNIMYLMHGTGDLEDYWLVKHGSNKTMLDNLIYYGDIGQLIVVTPTWYAEDDCADDPDKLTYAFKDELRNDLIAAVETKYSTYATDVTASGLISSRDHRAFAGLSRGSATMFRAAFNGSLDYFSWFGAFSACMTTKEEFDAGIRSDAFKDYSINYLYNTSGSFDFLLEEHVQNVRSLLEIEPRLTWGRNCLFDVFPANYHSIDSWRISLYNCLQKFF